MGVRFTEVFAADVFNLTSPRYLPSVALKWKGSRGWHNPRYEPVRDLCESMYVDAFNAFNGHYRKLEESILAEGFRNPVMLTTGSLLKRHANELPLHVRKNPRSVVCEYVGGSRLYVAARLGLKVPAIINDQRNIFTKAEEIRIGDGPTLLSKFKDRPRKVIWKHNTGTVYVNFLPYTHFSKSERDAAERVQSSFRRTVIADIESAVNKWMASNDHP